jgi:hypothetical protein
MAGRLGVTSRQGLRRHGLRFVVALLAWSALAVDVGAQQPTAPGPSVDALVQPFGVSPGGAFLRSALVPGWGHAAIGSYTRGGFYFILESATAYTFLRTRRRLSEANQRAALRESVVRENLADEGISDPQEIETRIGQDEALSSFQDLADSRKGQQEDLVAFGIFLLFLSGADAYVSAHLARFPAPIEVQVAPMSAGRAEVSLSIPLPNFR